MTSTNDSLTFPRLDIGIEPVGGVGDIRFALDAHMLAVQIASVEGGNAAGGSEISP